MSAEMKREIEKLKVRVENYEDALEKIDEILTNPSIPRKQMIMEIAAVVGVSRKQIVNERIRRAS